MVYPLISRSESSHVHAIAPGLAGLRTVLVNVFFIGEPGGRWILVDTGIPGSGRAIRRAAAERFGAGSRPSAIVLTHGHFDHVGAVRALARDWQAPVYAHPFEMPYLCGGSSYPPPDPAVGGGAMAWMSPLFPRGPIDVRKSAVPLPEDGTLPGHPAWRWIHTPGHTPGHVSLYREEDGVLVAGDALITTRQESAWSVFTQRVEVHGPPAYYTSDWNQARESVRRLAGLKIRTLASGHGLPLAGAGLAETVDALARNFDRVARPRHGRYSDRPAISGPEGVRSAPPPVVSPALRNGLMIGAGLMIAATVFAIRRRR